MWVRKCPRGVRSCFRAQGNFEFEKDFAVNLFVFFFCGGGRSGLSFWKKLLKRHFWIAQFLREAPFLFLLFWQCQKTDERNRVWKKCSTVPVWQRVGWLKLFRQCTYGNNIFQKGAFLSLSPNPSPLAFAGNWAEQRPVFRGCAGARWVTEIWTSWPRYSSRIWLAGDLGSCSADQFVSW